MTDFSYLDLDISIEGAQGQYSARIISSPAGKASGKFNLPFDQKDLEILLLRLGRPRSASVRRMETPEMQITRAYGERLFKALFETEEMRICFRSSLTLARRQNLGLRVRLRIAEPQLADLPWEYLYDPVEERPIILSRETPIIRYYETNQVVTPITITLPLNVLVMVSSPHTLPALSVEDEWRKIQEALSDLISSNRIKVDLIEESTPAALQRKLRKTGSNYHIFHFIGHGSFDPATQDGVLVFTDERGMPAPVNGNTLGILLRDHRSLRLAVLNSCEGARTSITDPFAGVAQSLLLQGLPSVIAMQFEITDDAAIILAREFYAALADGYPVEAALGEARRAIFASNNYLEWGTPVFFSRSDDGHIFNVPANLPPPPNRSETREDSLQEDKSKLAEEAYMEGLSAFYSRDYDRAIQYFRRSLKIVPESLKVTQKLVEAESEQNLARQYAQAVESIKNQEWSKAVELLQGILSARPDYQDCKALLQNAQKQSRLASLYDDAMNLFKARKWTAVEEIFKKIDLIEQNYPDPGNFRKAASEEYIREQRLERLNGLYNQALKSMEARHWNNAVSLLQKITEEEPGFRDVQNLISAAKREAQKAELEENTKARQAEIARAYNQALLHLENKQWSEARTLLERVAADEPGYMDTSTLLARCLEEERNKAKTVLKEVKIKAAEVARGREETLDQKVGLPTSQFTGLKKPNLLSGPNKKWVILGFVFVILLLFSIFVLPYLINPVATPTPAPNLFLTQLAP